MPHPPASTALTRPLPSPLALFALLTAAVYAVALGVAARLPELPDARPVAVGLTLDLVLVVPLAYYLLAVRRRGLPAVTVVPVFVLSVVAAAQILPAGHRAPLRLVEFLAVPAELGLLAWIAWRAARGVRAARRAGAADPLERLRAAALEVTGNDRAAGILATELGALVYLVAWRSRPHVPDGAVAFTHHRRCGHGAIVAGFLLVLAAEGLAVHVLLRRWSAVAAWIVTGLTVYGGLWLLADARATARRPLLVAPDRLTIRAGLRFTLHVPRAKLAGVGREKPPFGKECAALTLLAPATCWVAFTEALEAQGPYGLRRKVRAVGVAPDEAAEFLRAVGREEEDRRPIG